MTKKTDKVFTVSIPTADYKHFDCGIPEYSTWSGKYFVYNILCLPMQIQH